MREFKLSNPLLSKEQYEEMYAESFNNKEQFWSKVAKSQLTWSKDFTKVKNTNYDGDVSIKWFEDGELNVCYNCVDRHAETQPNEIAVIWEGDDTSKNKTYTYKELKSEVSKFANVLKKAQDLGYAEPGNPKLDLNGYDALAKIKILSSLAFNKKVSKSNCLMEGIENIEYKDIEIASQLNFRIKLLGITEIINGKLFERVHPSLVNKDSYKIGRAHV